MGSTDQAFAALIEDMDDRGLLADTLVCFISEFGRTPRINKYQGRDHWTSAYSIAFAGAGVRGGQKRLGRNRCAASTGVRALEDKQRYVPHTRLS